MAEISEQSNSQGLQQQPNESVLNEAQELLVQGKRFMALGDYQSATDSLEQAVQLFDAYYGVGKIHCADAYLEYGIALVALANLEAGSGTDKIMKKAGIEDGEDEYDGEEGDDDEGEEDGEDDEPSEDPSEGEAKKENGNKVEENGKATNGKEEPMEISPEKTKPETTSTSATVNAEPQPSSSSSIEPTPGTSSGNIVDSGDRDDDEEENGEATTIEIAWEVLCLAKRLFMTDESLEGRLKLAETYQKLGEISIEWENFNNAVDILQESLNIRKAILPPEDRLIALTYYHLGLAHSFKSETENANLNFQNAIDVIEKRIEILNKELETAKASQDTQKVSSCEKEINELKELLPDMTMRMDDTKEDGVETSEVLKRTREEIQQEDDEVKKVCSDTSKPVDDISHLVKRKAA